VALASSRRTFLISGAAAITVAGQSQPARRISPQLRYRMLGRTGLRVTELGVGSEAVSDISVFERALDSGLNFFDTARSYQSGNAEQALGAALRGKRDKVVLCTRSYAHNPQQIAADLDASLKALGTDHVDVWYLGQRDDPTKVTPEMLEVQRAAQKAGKTRFRGLSSHRIGRLADLVIEQKIDVVQIPYSFAIGSRRDPYKMDSTDLDTSLNRLKSAGVGVVAMKVMAGGYLRGRAGAHVAAIRWALRDDRIQTTSVRMSDVDQLLENLGAMSAGGYSDGDAALLAASLSEISSVLCRMCGACEGQCPQGVPASDVVRSVMYAEGYGVYEMGRAAFERTAGRLACAHCEACTVDCPNGVNVRERMARAAQLFS